MDTSLQMKQMYVLLHVHVILFSKTIHSHTQRHTSFQHSAFSIFKSLKVEFKVALGVCFALKFVERRFTSFHIFNYLM